ncbi:MAG: YraN family protein, partial [Planctomycetota bacterium]
RAGEAIERITAGKRRALSRSASFLAHRHGWHDVPMRFDVVAVQWDEASGAAPEVRHVRGAFEASS